MAKLKKVIIPIAGLGTRMLPVTKAIPKEMLPLAGAPLIQHIVKEAINSGLSEIIFVTNPSKASVKKHFRDDIKLENVLNQKINKTLLKEIKKISKLNSKITFINQNKPKGLGHAILTAKSLLANEPFAVILPDMIIDPIKKMNNLKLMKKNFEQSGESSILLAKAKKSQLKNYGIAKLKKRNTKDKFFPIVDVIEKPSIEKAPSNLFVAGRYIFDNEILNFLANEKPDTSGEIQLTGAISNFLNSSNIINGLLLDGDIYDCGNKLGYSIANLAFSFKDTDIKKEVLKFTKKYFAK